MKKISLFLTSMLLVAGVNAQSSFNLTGTSYVQDFNSLTSIAPNLPTGWHVYTGASATSLGNSMIDTVKALLGQYYGTPASNTSWSYSSGNFRNVASLDGVTSTAAYLTLWADTAAQKAATNRALGVRQVSPTNASFPNADSGADFAFQIANTSARTGFKLSFELQSLDSTSPRTTHWLVQYGFGANPTSFTTVSIVGADSTGGGHFYNDSISADFGSALDNNPGPVWIRIVTIVYSSHSGNRTTSAIDNFKLTWTGAGSARPNVTSTVPVNGTTGVALTSNLQVSFDKIISKGTGNIVIKNETDGTSQTKAVTSSDVTVSGRTATIAAVTLVGNKTYHLTFDSTAFDTASYNSYGIYDTTAWKFKTTNVSVPVYSTSSMQLSVLGTATSDHVNLAFTLAEAGIYTLRIYDLSGKQVYSKQINGQSGTNFYSVSDLNIRQGMYIVRLGNESGSGIARMVVE